MGRQEPPDQLLAAAVTVHVGGVQERDPGLRGRLEGGQRVSVGHLAPIAAQLPGPQPDHRDGAAGLAQNAFFHPPRVRATSAAVGGGRAWPGWVTSGGPAPVTTKRSNMSCVNGAVPTTIIVAGL